MLTKIRLADASHRLPLPGQPGNELTGDTVITVNRADPFWAALLRDGSIIEASDDAAPSKPTAKKEAR